MEKLHARGRFMAKEKNMRKHEEIVTDPFGSYTGAQADPNERPVQDADDL